MKRLILGISAAAILTLGAVPNTAQACGGYARVDPVELQIRTLVADHFSKVRRSVRLQGVALLHYDDSEAIARVSFVDRRQRTLSQEIRLVVRGPSWVVAGGSQPSIV